MCDSACKWRIVQNEKYILNLCETFLKSPTGKKYKILIDLCEQVFVNLPIVLVECNNNTKLVQAFFKNFYEKNLQSL